MMRVVFGLGEGKMELHLQKLQFIPGEKVTGTVKLSMNMNRKANGVRVELFAEQTTHVSVRDPKNGMLRTETRNQRVFSFAQELDSAHEYSGTREYSFEILIPQNAGAQAPIGGVLGSVVALGQTFGGLPKAPRWFVRAALDIPMGIDISAQTQINVGT